MIIDILFFASFKEQLNCAARTIELPEGARVIDLCEKLALKGGEWGNLFDFPTQKLKISVNQEIADISFELRNGDEVAFFPPVTGG
ncbi:MoaD/ThiS family protein [Aliikangiella maris]|uniref:MoaD/ThiS family protein n=2 Tax=Aliikangiella maris TaxID=3162458 RepID=A0ABV3MIC5_9GAMM